MKCEIIFVLDDGTELLQEKELKKNLFLFPPNILEKMKPIFIETLYNIRDWNNSTIRVYQNGTYDIIDNITPELPFNI